MALVKRPTIFVQRNLQIFDRDKLNIKKYVSNVMSLQELNTFLKWFIAWEVKNIRMPYDTLARDVIYPICAEDVAHKIQTTAFQTGN